MTEREMPSAAEPEGQRRLTPQRSLLAQVQAVNVGVRDFATALSIQGVPCVQVDWEPPEAEDPEMHSLLNRLL